MAAHTERMKRFENTIFKQREEINGRMTEMLRLLKELTTSRTPEKGSNERKVTPNNTKKPTDTGMKMPVNEVEIKDEAENRAGNESIKTPKSEEVVEAPGSQPVAYYLKHKINEKLIKGLVNNNRFNNSLSRTRVGKKKKTHIMYYPGACLRSDSQEENNKEGGHQRKLRNTLQHRRP
ncbi:hypothetical protein Tco_1071048 [Tanacetum coccineum]|uniref:Uncharacterized protein n=1 Tax=Tanacetum coccineum TaxID=301880 RepID=A0ABQ5HN68_9ASTR